MFGEEKTEFTSEKSSFSEILFPPWFPFFQMALHLKYPQRGRRSSADPVPLRGSRSCPAMVIASTPAVLCAHSPTLMPVSCGAQPSRTAQVLDQRNNWSWGSGWGRRHRIGNPTPLGLGPALLGGGCYTKSSGPRSPGDGFGHVRNS